MPTIPDFSEPIADDSSRATKNWFNYWKRLRLGTTTNDDALPGEVGEYVSFERPYGGLPVSSGVLTNICTISLTAGDWDVWFPGGIFPAGTTITTGAIGCISLTSATLENTPSSRFYYMTIPTTGFVGGGLFQGFGFTCGPTRLSLAATTTVYGVGFAVFTVSTMNIWGHLQARRVR